VPRKPLAPSPLPIKAPLAGFLRLRCRIFLCIVPFTFLLCTCAPDGMPADMVLVAAGPFRMGLNDARVDADERRVHIVELSDFYIDKYEVTNAQFAQFIEATGYVTRAEEEGAEEREDGISWRYPEGRQVDMSGRREHPVVYVSWYDARAYCAWRGKRLPSEAEWEKSARGMDGRLFPWGKTFAAGRANVWGEEDGFASTAPVGQFALGGSPYGVDDMAGNVWEWCEDWYGEEYYSGRPEVDPQGSVEGRFKVLRGGAWINRWNVVRATNRFKILPVERSGFVGFRCVKTP